MKKLKLDLLARVYPFTSPAFEHLEYKFDELVQICDGDKDAARLLAAMIDYHNQTEGRGKIVDVGDLDIEHIKEKLGGVRSIKEVADEIGMSLQQTKKALCELGGRL